MSKYRTARKHLNAQFSRSEAFPFDHSTLEKIIIAMETYSIERMAPLNKQIAALNKRIAALSTLSKEKEG